MSPVHGKGRRGLLASAIDSIGAAEGMARATNTSSSTTPKEMEVIETAKPEGASFLARRGAGIVELNRKVKRLTIRVKPSECSIWPGNARNYDLLTADRCASLIDSIREEGGNREPVIVRRTESGKQPYELLVGTRRHFCVSWLESNNHPEIELLASIETLDDEAAFRLADLENREREDVSDLERALNYKHAVDIYYGGVRSRMADRLAISRQNLHNLLQLAELPNEVINAFDSPMNIAIRHGMRLSPLLKDKKHCKAIISEALKLKAEQVQRNKQSQKLIESAKIVDRLVAVTTTPRNKPQKIDASIFNSINGVPLGQIIKDTSSKGLTINIKPDAATSVDDILEALRPVIARAKCIKT